MTGRAHKSLGLAFAIGTLVLAGAAAPAAADEPTSAAAAVSFTVNSANDVVADFNNNPGFTVCHTGDTNNVCTLRAAVMNANRHAGGATIILPAGLYVMQIPPSGEDDDDTGDFNLANAITLTGAGPGNTIIDGASLDQIFEISNGRVTMTGVTLQHGAGPSSFSGGLTVEGSSVLHLSNSALRDNTDADEGAALSVYGNATLDRVTVADNFGSPALYDQGRLTLTNSSVYDNENFDVGGAIYNFNGTLTVFNSTLSNNRTGTSGGALENEGTATLLADTLAGNLADDTAQGSGSGGAIENAGALLMGNTLLADNFVSHTLSECSGTGITSLDYNDVEGGGCVFSGTVSHNLAPILNLLLGPLAANGGPTLTRALFPGNPAVDQIPPALCRDLLGAAPVPDQRGVTRPIGPACDIGAFEGAPPQSPYFRNLVFNGDAESSAGAPSGAWVGVPGWTIKGGQFTAVQYNAAGGFPAVPTDTVPSTRGLNFFAGGRAADSLAAQVVPLPPALAASVNAGAVRFVFSADLGGFGSQTDNAQVLLRFQDNVLTTLPPSPTLGPVTAAQRGNETAFIHQTATGLVPANTAWLVFDVTMTRQAGCGGCHNDGYADNISLVLLPKFELDLPLIVK